ncbi:MAG: histidine kinase [Butyrivibrio sp.]|nr:histidine kinase [Butyrivibrio sp.]
MKFSGVKEYTGIKEKHTLSSGLKKLIFGIVFIVVISFMMSTYVITANEQMDNNIQNAENVLMILSSNITSEMQKYTSLSRLVITEERLVSFLRAPVSSVDIGMINDARYGIMDILNVTEGVDCVMAFREDMIMVATNRFTYDYDYEVMNGEAWKKEIYDRLGSVVFMLNSNNIACKYDGRAVVTIGRAIYDIDSQDRTGILLMNISGSVFDRMLLGLKYDDICIVGNDGTFIAGNSEYADCYDESFNSEDIVHRNIKLKGKKMFLSGCKVKDMPLVILRVVPYGMEGIPFRMLCILLFLMIVFFLMASIVIIYIRDNITEPIFKLSKSMEKNKLEGELKKIDVYVPNSELDMLQNDYNNMIDHVNELIDKLMEKEKNLQKAQMRVLQEQIKPHFLYNSIETIGFMAMDAGAEDVHDALETLGSFYRNFLSKGDKVIALSREITIVRDYLSLQRLRYGDIVEDKYEIEEDTLNFIIPKLILQPLVENSIYHGIRLKGEKGQIIISSKLKDRELHLIIKDTGIGMKKELIDKILVSKREEMNNTQTESFGLWGTIERIRYYAGKDDVVSIRSEIGEYTEIELIIPDMPAEKGEQHAAENIQSNDNR